MAASVATVAPGQAFRAVLMRMQVPRSTFEAAVEHAADPAAVIDDEGRVVFANVALGEWCGDIRARLLGRPWLELSSSAEIAGAVRPRWRDALSRGEAPSGHPSGEGTGALEVIWRYVPLDGPGRCVAVVGESRREVRWSHRVLMDRAPDGIFIADPSGRFVDVNPQGCAMVGYTREELLGQHIEALIPPEDRAERPPRLDELSGAAPLRTERNIRQKDGSPLAVEMNSSTLDGGFLLSLVRDTRERRHAEEVLRRSERMLRSVMEQLPDAVVVHRKGLIVFANAAAAQMMGFDGPERLAGRPVLDIIHPDDRKMVFERIREMISTGMPAEPINERILRADGTELVTEVTALPIEFEGEPALLAVARDVSDRLEMQARLAQTDRLASVGLLAAGVAHEINNPLTWVLLNLARIQGAPGDPGAPQWADEAADGARRVQRIVQELRSFARTDDAEREVVMIGEVVDTALRLASNETRFRARVVRAGGPEVAVEANEGRLLQVLLNLLVNAAHAIEEGHPERNEITVAWRLDAGTVRIDVRDTGPGIAPEHLPRLFNAFFTTKPRGRGSGLGLWISQNIARSYGGRVEVASAPGAGSTFTVVLDVARAPRGGSAGVAGVAARGPRRRVLLVDDEPMLVATLQPLLARQHDLATASSGAEALALLERDRGFEVVLCDVMMPGVSGIDVHARLSEFDPRLAGRMIFMTGGAFTEQSVNFLASAPNRTIQKPFDLGRLLGLIEEVAQG